MVQEKKPLNVEIGMRIQTSRERAGLTQEQLAERIDRSAQFISTIERGVAGPSLETILSLCSVLNVSCDWILRGREVTPSTDYIAAKLAAFSPEQLVIINRIADNLLELVQ